MKRISLFLAALSLTIIAFGRQPQRGYRGFIDWDNNLTSYSVWIPDNRVTYFYSGVSTSHGYQFNPNFFLGAGLSIEYNKYSDSFVLPVFMQFRTDQKFGKFTPFGDLRLGFSCTDGGGLYAAPVIGYRFNWGRKAGFNIGVGLTIKGSTVDIFDIGTDDEGYQYLKYVGHSHQTKLMFAFRVGLDF